VDPEKTQTITTWYFSAKFYVLGARMISSEESLEESYDSGSGKEKK